MTSLLLFAVTCSVAVQLPSKTFGTSDNKIVLKYEMTEELPLDSNVADLIVDSTILQDASLANSLRFDIFTGSHKDFFKVDAVSGLVRVNRAVDRERVCSKRLHCSLTFDVTVTGAQQFFLIFRLEVTVLDINDNLPTFPSPDIKVDLSESSAVGSTVLLPAAYDLDSDSFGLLRYEYECNSSNVRLDVFDSPDGFKGIRIVVAEPLDRETTTGYSMVITAFDGGIPPKSGTTRVTISVSDVNDNIPMFDLDLYSITLREDFPVGEPFVKVHATDRDEGINGEVFYALARTTTATHGDMFRIDNGTGHIWLSSHLEYQRESEYTLSIMVTDLGLGAGQSFARLIIAVLDVNDHSPTIRFRSDYSVAENEPPGAFVGHVSVDDADSGDGGKVTCSIASRDFHLTPFLPGVFKLLTTTSFDREVHAEYFLTIACHDFGEPEMTSSVEGRVIVGDVNDNEPRFESEVYTASIAENNTRGVFVVQVNAVDDDAGENSTISYTLSGDVTNVLRINATSGIISAAAVFDFEEKNHFEFSVIAADNGHSVVRSSMVKVLLSVSDTNDETPTFSQASYSFGTYENQPPGTEIGTVTSTDRDAPPFDERVYSLVHVKPTATSTFRIDPHTGKITTLRVLDREQYAVYHFTAKITNTAYPYLSSAVPVVLYVADRNDNAPSIQFPTPDNYTVEVSHHAPAGHVFARITASDADIGVNAKFIFSFAKGNEDDLFEVDPSSGAVSVKRPLQGGSARKYGLSVLVRDGGDPEKSASAQLEVVVDRSAAASFQNFFHEARAENTSSDFRYHREMIIVLACVTSVLVIVLVTAIICIRRKKAERGGTHVYHIQRKNEDAMMISGANYCRGTSVEVGDGTLTVDEGQYFCRSLSEIATHERSRMPPQTRVISTAIYPYHQAPPKGDDPGLPPRCTSFARSGQHDCSKMPYKAQSSLLDGADSTAADGRSAIRPTCELGTDYLARYNGDKEAARQEVHRLLDMLRKGQQFSPAPPQLDDLDNLSFDAQSCLDSGLGPSETDIDSLQTTQLPLLRAATLGARARACGAAEGGVEGTGQDDEGLVGAEGSCSTELRGTET